jgi:UDP-GlcNAc3NAcA epimerase
VLQKLQLTAGSYVHATCHRAENTDDLRRLAQVLGGLATLARSKRVVLPIHPRTLGKVREFGLDGALGGITVIDPVSYLEMVALEKHAEAIVTDSGGVQKEAFFYRVPCVTARDETEWVETVDSGWNTLAGADAGKIVAAVLQPGTRRQDVNPYGAGNAAELILDVLLELH